MKIILVNGKPHQAVDNGFKAIPTLLYQALLEREKIEIIEEITHD